MQKSFHNHEIHQVNMALISTNKNINLKNIYLLNLKAKIINDPNEITNILMIFSTNFNEKLLLLTIIYSKILINAHKSHYF